MTTGKTIALTRQAFVGNVKSLLFNMLSRSVKTFLPRSKRLNVIAAVTICSDFGAQENKILTVSIISSSICHEVMEPHAMILVFWMLIFKLAYSLSSFTFFMRLFSSSSLSAIRVVSSAYLRLLISLLAILNPVCASFHMIYSALCNPALRFTWCILHISKISRVTIYSLVVIVSQFWTSLLFHVQF